MWAKVMPLKTLRRRLWRYQMVESARFPGLEGFEIKGLGFWVKGLGSRFWSLQGAEHYQERGAR